MKRIFEIRVNLTKGISYGNEMIFTQGDNQTHYLKIIFEDKFDFNGKSMKINFIKPNRTSVFSMVTELKSENEIIVPNNALTMIGDILIEVVLIDGERILTVNSLGKFIVTQTVAGAELVMIPGDTLISDINDLILQLNEFMRHSKEELDQYTSDKKLELDNHKEIKKQELNTHTNSKKEEINNHVTAKELEIDQLVEGEKVELTSHTNIKKTELDKYIVDNRATLKGEKGDKGEKGEAGSSVDISGKMDKYQIRFDIRDYDDLITDGFYILKGSASNPPSTNAPYGDPALVQVWTWGNYIYQKAVAYHDVRLQFTRCFYKEVKNTKWERIVNTANYSSMCPYSIGDILLTASNQNPAVRFLGTTWEKIEGRFLLATSGSNASGATGGSNTKTISKANLPNIKLQIDSFALTTQPHTHPITFKSGTGVDNYPSTYASNYSARNINTGEGGGQNTGTASPFTSALGSGTPLDITPSFYTVHIWKRIDPQGGGSQGGGSQGSGSQGSGGMN